jgi:multimeric flavodoxin WrbA
MKIIVHDLNPQEFAAIYQKDDADVTVISDNGTIHNCIGCFGCWIKTPGVCVLKDGYNHITESLCKCSELIIISRCMYGSYSPFIRNVWDRSLPYLLPYFVTRNGETHHTPRYGNKFNLTVHFYGDDITEAERETAKALVAANGVNFYSKENSVYFHKNPQEIREALN